MRAVAVDTVPAAPQVSDVESPRPEAGEVLVRVSSASVNGFDLSVAAGYVQGMMEHRFPLVLGKDFAGTVAELGEGVEGFAVGDAVFGVVMKPVLQVGTLAQYTTVPAAYGLAHIPGGCRCGTPGRSAWPVPPPSTAWTPQRSPRATRSWCPARPAVWALWPTCPLAWMSPRP